MWKAGVRTLLGLVLGAALLAAPPRKKAPPVPPPLLPGEALALATPDHEVFCFGDAASESPMGGLSHLVWTQLEGEAWLSDDVGFRCVGKAGPYHCSYAAGHGKVDLQRAMLVGCNLAFMGWARSSAERWAIDYGEGAARTRLLDSFGPFLGRRLPDEEGVPELNMDWFGEGDLLRTSPGALMRWLVDPAQEAALRLYRRLALTFYDETFGKNVWWIDPELAPVTGAPKTFQAWAVGGNDLVVAILRLPPGSTRAEAQARFTAIMVPKKPIK
jgi:hypothetical protein